VFAEDHAEGLFYIHRGVGGLVTNNDAMKFLKTTLSCGISEAAVAMAAIALVRTGRQAACQKMCFRSEWRSKRPSRGRRARYRPRSRCPETH